MNITIIPQTHFEFTTYKSIVQPLAIFHNQIAYNLNKNKQMFDLRVVLRPKK